MKMAILMLFTKSLHSSNDISMIILIVGFQVSARFWEALCIANVFFFSGKWNIINDKTIHAKLDV